VAAESKSVAATSRGVDIMLRRQGIAKRQIICLLYLWAIYTCLADAGVRLRNCGIYELGMRKEVLRCCVSPMRLSASLGSSEAHKYEGDPLFESSICRLYPTIIA
jgi:hypothetical protein